MRVGFLFHKVPQDTPSGIDQVRLKALSSGLKELGANVAVIAPVSCPALFDGTIPVLPLDALFEKPGLDVLKVCYHFSMELLGGYDGLLACRFVRVVDEDKPDRDGMFRNRLLAAQTLAAQKASGIIVNNRENAIRWQARYGHNQKIAIIPTGCPSEIPSPVFNPYDQKLPVLLFLGSLSSARMVRMINDAAGLLQGKIAVHFIGRNKSAIYGGFFVPLSPLVADHGEKPEEEVWDYIRHARIGLALAASSDPFDNDLSKILSYLRGGLPILCEERIPNIRWALNRERAVIFRFGDPEDLCRKALQAVSKPSAPHADKEIQSLLNHHSWSTRSKTLYRFLKELAG